MFEERWLNQLAALRTIGVLAIATLALSACVELQVPLLTDTKPLVGQQFEAHLYENFIDGKANDFHASIFRWKNGRYERASGLSRDVTSFVAQPLEGNDFIIQGSDVSEKVFNYWIGRKLVDGVYLIFPLNEDDLDTTARNTICAKDQQTGVCIIQTYNQLVTMARATAAKPARDTTLGVLLAE